MASTSSDGGKHSLGSSSLPLSFCPEASLVPHNLSSSKKVIFGINIADSRKEGVACQLVREEEDKWQEEVSDLTCLEDVELEKEKPFLQLECFLSVWQNQELGLVDFIIPSHKDDFFQAIGLKWLKSWFSEKCLQNYLFTWVFLHFSPTRVLILQWFKGELITMLMGGFCSLGRKEKKQLVQQYSSYDMIRRILFFRILVFCFYLILEGKDLFRGKYCYVIL